MAHQALKSNRVLGISLGQPRGLLWFRVQSEHPSEAEDVKGFEFNSCILQQLGITPTCHTLEVKTFRTVF